MVLYVNLPSDCSVKIAIEHGPVEIVVFPIKMVDLPIAMLNYQRVTNKSCLVVWNVNGLFFHTLGIS